MKRTKTQRTGQHFLTNTGVLKKIIACISAQKDELIIEIGAGRGVLTFPLTEHAGKVIAIEKDTTLTPCLKKKNIPNLVIVEADVLEVSLKDIIGREKTLRDKVKVVGNLPYSISSPLLFKLLENRNLFSECHLLFQKEVAERICAQPGSKKYAPLSILFQIDFETKLNFTVSPGSFFPPPRVYSSLVSLLKRKKPLYVIRDELLFSRFLRTAFRLRRKTLRNNLATIGLPRDRLDATFASQQLEGTIRPEQLSIGQFVALFNLFFDEHAKNRFRLTYDTNRDS